MFPYVEALRGEKKKMAKRFIQFIHSERLNIKGQ